MNRQIFYERLNDQIPNENVKALKESFAYHYRNEAENKKVRLKISVSEIKRMSQAADTEEVMYSSVSMEKEKRIPSFVKKTEKISAASKRYDHSQRFFELLDFFQRLYNEKFKRRYRKMDLSWKIKKRI